MHTCGPMVFNLFVGLDDPMINLLRSPAARSRREKPSRPRGASYALADREQLIAEGDETVASSIAPMISGEVVCVSALTWPRHDGWEWRGDE